MIHLIKWCKSWEAFNSHASTSPGTSSIWIIHLIIHQPFPLLSYFSVVVCQMFVRSYFCRVLHIHSGKTRILFSPLLWSLWRVQIVGYVMACRWHSFVCTLHYLIIIIVQTYLYTMNLWNVCQIYFVECVSKNEHTLSYPLFNIWGCMFSVYPIPSWWLREYIALFYYHHQNGSMNYYPLFRVRSWKNGMRCMSLYILLNLSWFQWYIFYILGVRQRHYSKATC